MFKLMRMFATNFRVMLQGFDAQLLYVHKFNVGESYANKNYIFNKTNMNNVNLILNFNFWLCGLF